ncbi:uncharacterized protein YjbK [Scopulibacillus daqui]|uniref:Uncharacterized protein YjbK n=1 Tax=Scopulibacillus daqui TaxID=1469162 RepID=A0ABS2PVF4_9BACL|nr:uncharacterized protein YjbK [Scopulibacillus daqui]
MNQELEIEFKNMLTKAEFEQLRDHFHLSKCFVRQVNHYFDTRSFDLKQKGAALRIREKSNKTVLTLKQPHPEGLLETHQSINQQDAQLMIETGQMPHGDVRQAISTLGIHDLLLQYLGALTTDRAQKTYHNGELVLDHSRYNDTEDYELEYEAADADSGRKTFNQLLSQFQIPERKTDNKIKRFFDSKENYPADNL